MPFTEESEMLAEVHQGIELVVQFNRGSPMKTSSLDPGLCNRGGLFGVILERSTVGCSGSERSR